jgi:hypothetical protein
MRGKNVFYLANILQTFFITQTPFTYELACIVEYLFPSLAIVLDPPSVPLADVPVQLMLDNSLDAMFHWVSRPGTHPIYSDILALRYAQSISLLSDRGSV